MKLIFLYGPPAVGKLTVANEIASRTGFKVFHNHMSVDAIEPVFSFGSHSFNKLVEMIRVETVAEAARENVDLVYTFCYAKGIDEKHVERITKAVEDHGGQIFFVLLTATKDELKRRVVFENRQRYGKAKTVEKMESFFETYDLFSEVPNRETFTIENTIVQPGDAAGQIVERFNLA
ncbi:MAG: AAA family ATPase [Acidobacteriota bacterium]